MMAVLATALILAGCGSSYSSYATADTMSSEIKSSYSSSYDAAEGSYEETEYSSDVSDDSVDASKIEDVDTSKKIIRNMSLSVETTDLTGLDIVIQSKVAELGGYIEHSYADGSTTNITGYYLSEDGNTYYDSAAATTDDHYAYRTAYYTVRIPVDKLDEFTEVVSESSNVTSQSTSTEDITTSYIDADSLRKTLEEEQEILNEMMKKATTVEEMIQVEDKLSDVRYELQNIKSQLKAMDNQVAYSTVAIDITEVKVLSNTTGVGASWTERVASGFKTSCEKVADRFSEGIIFILSNIPMFLFDLACAGIAIGIILGIIKLIARHAEKKSKKDVAENVVADTTSAPVKEENHDQ